MGSGEVVCFGQTTSPLPKPRHQTEEKPRNGRSVFDTSATLAEFERKLIAEHTRAGLAALRDRKTAERVFGLSERRENEKDNNPHISPL